MKVNWLAIVIILSLCGLMAVQIPMLFVSIRAEKADLDKEVYDAMAAIQDTINNDSLYKASILALQQQRVECSQLDDVLVEEVAGYLDEIVENELYKKGLREQFSIALSESYLNYSLLATNGYESSDFPAYRAYLIRFEGDVQQECECDLFLHLQLHSIFPTLFKRLYPILFSSIGFVLMLLLCCLLLVRTSNQQKKLVQIKNDFINNLAHELKTPTFSTSLLLRLLKASLGAEKDSKQEQYLALLQQENDAIKEHIEKVLELARLSDSHYRLSLKPLSLLPLMERIIDTFEHRVKEKKGMLDYELPKADIVLMADEIHLQNAIQNLLDNALKYGGEPPAVHIQALPDDAYLKIIVRDNGKGIERQEHKKIFNKFYRMPTANQSNVKGFGLGLAYVREVMKAHGGQVLLDSHPGSGSAFVLKIPCQKNNISYV
jgi:two-component system phosphate regulon sensor histidine kinase PhoR